ncbi:MAG: transcription termination/antitermination protein NusG [Planctomycetota bacterium]|jgi:transcriptional antiterminator NusG|nr:transcription termination/antitermination protein NusG [Planctomycetota bacterium]
MKMQWYVLRVASGQEDRVRRGLETRVKAKGLEERVTRILVPTETVTELRGGKRRTMRKKIYPGYVIVEMDLDNDTRYLVRETPGVGDFIGTHGNPEPLTEDEVAKLMGQIQRDTEKPKLKIQFRAGDAVKIKEGPFENYDGVIEEVDAQKGAVRVVITVFNRPTPVELGYWQVEAI